MSVYREPDPPVKRPPVLEYRRAIAAIGEFSINEFVWDPSTDTPSRVRISSMSDARFLDVTLARLTGRGVGAGALVMTIQRDKDGAQIDRVELPDKITGRAAMNAILRTLSTSPGSTPQVVVTQLDEDMVETADGRRWRMTRYCPPGRWCYRVGDPINARERLRTGQFWPHPFMSDYHGTTSTIHWCIVDVADDIDFPD